MKIIYVRKIFPYDPTFAGRYSRYHGYAEITLQKAQPVITGSQIMVLADSVIEPIFCSSLLRACQTAEVIKLQLGNFPIKTLTELNEVLFDLTSLVSEEEFNHLGSKLVRERFKKAFINDNLIESRHQIKRRLNRLLNKLKKLTPGSYLLISHSFLMKILQAYLREKELFDKPELLEKYLIPEHKTFNFGEGFEFSI